VSEGANRISPRAATAADSEPCAPFLVTLIGPERTADLVVDADTPVTELLPSLLAAGGVRSGDAEPADHGGRHRLRRRRPEARSCCGSMLCSRGRRAFELAGHVGVSHAAIRRRDSAGDAWSWVERLAELWRRGAEMSRLEVLGEQFLPAGAIELLGARWTARSPCSASGTRAGTSWRSTTTN
jgi:hypothetical protein